MYSIPLYFSIYTRSSTLCITISVTIVFTLRPIHKRAMRSQCALYARIFLPRPADASP